MHSMYFRVLPGLANVETTTISQTSFARTCAMLLLHGKQNTATRRCGALIFRKPRGFMRARRARHVLFRVDAARSPVATGRTRTRRTTRRRRRIRGHRFTIRLRLSKRESRSARLPLIEIIVCRISEMMRNLVTADELVDLCETRNQEILDSRDNFISPTKINEHSR